MTSHPPYHLRPNKAIERYILVELLRKFNQLHDLSKYTYYGFGGPFLEDFRLLYEMCPEINMVSIEKDENTYKRQNFHLPCGLISLNKIDSKSFLADYNPKDEKSVFWLDNTDLKYGGITDFQTVLSIVNNGSIVKVTLRAEPKDYYDDEKSEKFVKVFKKYLPSFVSKPPTEFKSFAQMLQDILQIAAEESLPASIDTCFQPLTSFYYADSCGIFTLTGIVCKQTDKDIYLKHYKDWPYSNLAWNAPQLINIPMLSTKERLHLQRHLPCHKNAGKALLKELGYTLTDDLKTSEEMLEQYAKFHRYFPHFIRAMP